MKNYSIRFGSGDPRNSSGLSPTMLIFARADTGATVTPPAITEIATSWGLYTFQWGTTTPIAFLCDGATSSLGSGRYVTGSLDPADRSDEYGTTMIAIGTSHIAQGNTMIALGSTNFALGTTSVAYAGLNFGLGSTGVALGNLNFGLGSSNIALGMSNIALGTSNVALGMTNVALGTTNIAIGSSLSATSVTIVVSVAGIGSAGSTIGSTTTDPIDIYGYMKRTLEFLEGNASFDKSAGSWNLYSRGFSTLLRTKTLANTASGITKT